MLLIEGRKLIEELGSLEALKRRSAGAAFDRGSLGV
jgi:hypothetical protein